MSKLEKCDNLRKSLSRGNISVNKVIKARQLLEAVDTKFNDNEITESLELIKSELRKLEHHYNDYLEILEVNLDKEESDHEHDWVHSASLQVDTYKCTICGKVEEHF